MNIDLLASLIMRGTWLIDPRIALTYGPIIAAYLNGENVKFNESVEQPYLGTTLISPSGREIKIEREQAEQSDNVFSEAPAGSVAIIPVQGVIRKADGLCGTPGTDTIATWVRDARANENVVGIGYRVNSGGGAVGGTGELAQTVYETRDFKTSKTFVEEIMGSAATWIGSAASEVICGFETVEVGSIGTCIQFLDNSEFMKAMGYMKHYINADASIDKNQDFLKALGGDYSGLKINVLNPTNDIFLKKIKEYRAGRIQMKEVTLDGKTYWEPLTGKMYIAEQAIERGLADGIMSFENFISNVAETAFNDKSKTANHQKFFNMSLFNKHPKLSAAAEKGRKKEAITTADLEDANTELNAAGESGLVILEQSMVEGLESQLEAANLARTTAETRLQEALTAKQTADAALVTMSAERDKHKADAEKYGAQGGANPSDPKRKEGSTEEQGITTADDVAPWNSPSLEFNQIIDKGRAAIKR